MQEFRNEWNEHRIDKLEKKVDILIDGVSSNWEGTTNSFKAILDALETLKAEVKAGDLLLTMGAGDVYRIGEKFLER